jgi:hypothetical protein
MTWATTAAWVAGTSLAITAYSTHKQIEAAKETQKFREKQAEEERKRANIQNVRGMREQIRAQRAAAAQIENASALAGTSTSSGAAGGIAGTQADLAGNMAYMGQMSTLDQRVSELGVGAAGAQADAAKWGAIGGLSGTIFSGSGGFKAMKGS